MSRPVIFFPHQRPFVKILLDEVPSPDTYTDAQLGQWLRQRLDQAQIAAEMAREAS